MADEEETEISVEQKTEIAKWFLLNSPPGEIQYVAKGLSLFFSLYICMCMYLQRHFFIHDQCCYLQM